VSVSPPLPPPARPPATLSEQEAIVTELRELGNMYITLESDHERLKRTSSEQVTHVLEVGRIQIEKIKSENDERARSFEKTASDSHTTIVMQIRNEQEDEIHELNRRLLLSAAQLVHFNERAEQAASAFQFKDQELKRVSSNLESAYEHAVKHEFTNTRGTQTVSFAC